MKIILSLLISSICFSSCTWIQEHQYEGDIESEPSERTINSPIPGTAGEPGKCYAKCLIQDQYKTESVRLYKYTGQNPSEREGIEYHEILLKEASTKWEKVKPIEDCKSENPDECLEWCIVESPVDIEAYFIVLDTSSIKEYKDTTVLQRIIEKPSITQWKEILCSKYVTKELYRNIQLALIDKGYNVKSDGIISLEAKYALTQFQKENNLPMGALNQETIEALGLRW